MVLIIVGQIECACVFEATFLRKWFPDVRYVFGFKKYALVLEANLQINDQDSLGTEILLQTRKTNFDKLNITDVYNLVNSKPTELQNYLNWIKNSNAGLFYADQYMLISSVGYEKFLDRQLEGVVEVVTHVALVAL